MAPKRQFDRPAQRRLVAVAALAITAAACTPALNWRDVRLEGAGIAAAMPCKPVAYVRKLMLAATQIELMLHACSAGDATWAVATVDLHDPGKVAAALDELFAAAAANITAALPRGLPLNISGATPNPASRRVALEGRLPDGQAVSEQVAVFAKGTRVYQATVVGAALPVEDVESFFGALRFSP